MGGYAEEKQVKLKKLLRLEWDAIAGIIAAVVAIIMSFLQLIQQEVIITITVVLIALLFIRDLRSERATEQMQESLERTALLVRELQTNLIPPDAVLIGPTKIRSVSEEFASHARGDMIWFHVCLSMFKPQALFDALLKPAIENPRVTSIQFVLDENQKDIWETEVIPKINMGRDKEKVRPPRWTSIRESVSMIIANSDSTGSTECLLSFWGEPFMAQTAQRKVPRYIFHIRGHSELVARLIELERGYRFLT